MLVETSLSVFDLDYLLDALIATFFFSYTYFRLHHALHVAETLAMLVDIHKPLPSAKLVLFANCAE